MRSRILTSFLMTLAVAPAGVARAQAIDITGGNEEEAQQGGETEGAEVADEGGQPSGSPNVPNVQGARETAPGEVHTVNRGDTLWDLSQQYLGSPWYWPKVWSYNPEIANPHWIYPGNRVRFFPAGEEVPSRVETGTGPAEPMGDEGGLEAATEIGPANGADLVSVTGKIGFQPQGNTLVMTQGFVTSKEVDEAGKIDSSFSEAEMMSFPDTVYVRFKRKIEAKVGERFLVFRTVQEVKHPTKQNSRVGYLTELAGTLRVLNVSDKYVTAQITETWQPIVRGDLVGPYGERLMDRIAVKPNTKELKGNVVIPMVPYLTMTGEHSMLIVDKGSSEGVEVGNTFTVLRKGDTTGDKLLSTEVTAKDRALPDEAIGVCLVTEVKERTSNCLLTQSLREILPGDRIEMRVGNKPTASR
ncbi:LysM peptidoglycan-binding domain-containing protein [Hyalangium rubrum]|uniref:LysM peptidoglycan-binding domain-containing protein n=1 Tax=Hyalangium rubrum TaxID=3103134 RepID=A0ABU5GUC8_9BACT|nr:LysM peptidoglycan-binding domain-containing protein [Hyalangium sp. s54d21]MDY7224793.1 LysM peptidoglycan-binding domain-containing protein [Hyalangium sp. s54d21]